MKNRIYAICMFAMLAFASCKNEPKQDETAKEAVKENTIKLSNYSDENWNAGVGIVYNMFIVDNNAENAAKLKSVKELVLSDGTYVTVTGTNEAGKFIQILLKDKASTFQKLAGYPNDLVVQ